MTLAKPTRRAALAAPALLLAAQAAWAQRWPDRPVRLVVPYAPGSSGDIIARALAAELGEGWGQPVVIDNRAGSSGIAASEMVARARPDGLTFMLNGLNHVANPGLFPNLPFDTAADFSPLSLVGSIDLAMVTHPQSGFPTVADVVAAARAQPGRLNFASGGTGTGGHLSMELFLRVAGITMNHVPYRSPSLAITAVVAGQVPLLFTGVPPVVQLVREGRLRALLIAGPERVPQLPDTPTPAEAGLSDFRVNVWFGLLGPRDLPRPLVDAIAGATAAAVQRPGLAQRLNEAGVRPVGSSPEEFATVIAEDLAKWPRLIREAGIRAE